MNTNKKNVSMFSQETLTSLEMAEVIGGNDDTNILCSTNKTGKCSFNIICSNKENCKPCDNVYNTLWNKVLNAVGV